MHEAHYESAAQHLRFQRVTNRIITGGGGAEHLGASQPRKNVAEMFNGPANSGLNYLSFCPPARRIKRGDVCKVVGRYGAVQSTPSTVNTPSFRL